MRTRVLLALLLVFTFCVSCSRSKVYEKRHTFDKLNWNRFQPVIFDADIKDAESSYTISIMIRHHTVYPYPNLAMTMAIYSPGGERRVKDINIPLRDKDGTFKASGMGDLWDITTPVYQEFQFNEAGHYKFELENRMPKYDTPGIIELGILIEKDSN